MIYKVCVKAALLNLLLRKITSKLINYGTYHFEVPELLGTDVGEKSFKLRIRHRKTLREVAKRSTELTVGSAVLL